MLLGDTGPFMRLSLAPPRGRGPGPRAPCASWSRAHSGGRDTPRSVCSAFPVKPQALPSQGTTPRASSCPRLDLAPGGQEDVSQRDRTLGRETGFWTSRGRSSESEGQRVLLAPPPHCHRPCSSHVAAPPAYTLDTRQVHGAHHTHSSLTFVTL